MTPSVPRKRVVIVGAGFGGLNAAKALGDSPGVDVVLIDRKNHHLFQPLLYQVATAALSPADIAVPIRAELGGYANIAVHMGEVERVDLTSKVVVGGGMELTYDWLILACGTMHSYFGHSEWEAYAPGLKTLEQATEIRFRILSAFERAENTTDPAEQEALLTFVVVGGGPTGVELAGSLAEIARTVLVKDFRRIDPRQTRVVLVEAGPRILAMFPADLTARATQDLRDLGVEVLTDTRVTRVDAEGVTLGERRLSARTVLWGAGVEPSKLNRALGVEVDRSGRVVVGPDLALPSHPEVFVIGDQAHCKGADGNPLPGLAPVAMQAGKAAAANVLRDLARKPRAAFSYLDKGQMATIGKSKAILESKGVKLAGLVAWLGWLFIHVLYLIGFRNRLAVISSWAWAYVFTRRNARLIVGKAWRSYPDVSDAP